MRFPIPVCAALLPLLAHAAPGDFQLGNHTLPADCAELKPDPADAALPDEQNAFSILKKISPHKLAPGEKDFFSIEILLAQDPDSAHSQAKIALSKHSDALALWDKALAIPGYAEPLTLSASDVASEQWTLPFRSIREIIFANLWRIRIASQEGRHAEAFADWLRLRNGIERNSRRAGTLVSAMIWKVALGLVQKDAWRLTVTRTESAKCRARPASFDKEIWGNLSLREARFGVCITPITDDEIKSMMTWPFTHYAENGVNSVEDYRRIVSPLWGSPADRAHDALSEIHRLSAPGIESPAIFKSRLNADGPYFKRMAALSRYTGDMGGNLNAFEMTYFLTMNNRVTLTLADITVALRAYAGEHGGAYPETLSQLVPDYMDAVPTDPFDGKPLRYDPKRPAVWSIGPDFKDDNGTFSGISPILLRNTGDIVSTPHPVAPAASLAR